MALARASKATECDGPSVIKRPLNRLMVGELIDNMAFSAAPNGSI
jgi:hypothetical protein